MWRVAYDHDSRRDVLRRIVRHELEKVRIDKTFMAKLDFNRNLSVVQIIPHAWHSTCCHLALPASRFEPLRHL